LIANDIRPKNVKQLTFHEFARNTAADRHRSTRHFAADPKLMATVAGRDSEPKGAIIFQFDKLAAKHL
jgi:hypothetical protein